jgi:3-oxoadipate enol-lactonase
MPKISVRDIEMNYREEGAGFPLVLIHGLNGDLTGWSLAIPELAKQFRTLAIDVRGHGESGKPDQPYSIKEFSQDLWEFICKMRITQAHFLGLSMGGAIAQQFALDYPPMVRSLILISTFSHVDDSCQRAFIRLRQALKAGGYPAFFDEVVKLGFTPHYRATNPKAIADLKEKRIRTNSPIAIGRAIDACLAFHLRGQIAEIQNPTLVVSGREDVFTPIHLAEEIHGSICDSQWVILDGVGHNLYIEKASEMVQAVLKFLRKIPAGK